MSILVGGGSGFVGKCLRPKLSSIYKVYTITRNPSHENDLSWSDISAKGLPDNCHAVICLQGSTLLKPFRPFNETTKQEIRSSRIDTTKHLVTAMISKPPKFFVGMSGVGFYPPIHEKVFDENSSPGNDFVAKVSIDTEAASILPSTISTRRIILRSGIVLGKSGGMIQSMYWQYFMGLGGPMGNGKQWLPWIHVDDLTNLIVHLIDPKNQLSGVFNAVAPEIITNKDFAKAFARSFTPSRPCMFNVPSFVVNCMFGKELANVVLKGQQVISKRINETGFKFTYPTIEKACASLH